MHHLAVQLVDQEPGGGFGHLHDGLAHRGERRPQARGDLGVVKADNGQVTGHGQAPLPGLEQNTRSHVVVARDDGARRFRQIEQFARRGLAGIEIEVALPNQGGRECDAMPFQGTPVSGKSHGARAMVRMPLDEPDGSMSLFNQDLRERMGRLPVIAAHVDLLGLRILGGYRSNGNAQLLQQRGDGRNVPQWGRQNDSFDAGLGGELPDPRRDVGVRQSEGAKQKRVAPRLASLERAVEHVLEVAEFLGVLVNQPHQARTLAG